MSNQGSHNTSMRLGKVSSEIADIYDGIVDQYVRAFFYDLTDAPWLDRFIAALPAGTAILDIGCGPGNFAQYLVQSGFRVTGIDISSRMIEAARALVPAATFLLMDCSRLDLPSGAFGGALIAYSLLHLPKQSALQTLHELKRVLRPPGVLCLLLKRGEGEHYIPFPLAPKKKGFVCLWEPNEVRRALSDAGFSVFDEDEAEPTAEEELKFAKMLFLATLQPK